MACAAEGVTGGGGWMARGVLFLVVGPSGVGKDTLIDAARASLAEEAAFVFVRRVVTRPADAGGEDHEAMEPVAFAAAEAAGAFCVTWRAHGLCYGIRTEALADLDAGRNVVINASRGAIAAFAAFADPVVLLVTAPPEAVRARLAARGREDAASVAARLARHVPLDGAATVLAIDNGGDLATGTERFLDALLGAAHLPLALVRAPLDPATEGLCMVHSDAAVVRGRRLAGSTTVEIAAPDGATAGGGPGRVRARLLLVRDASVLARDCVALSDGPFDRLGLAVGDPVLVRPAPPAATRDLLRRKVAGDTLTATQIGRVVRDIVDGVYTPAEIAGFLVAAASHLTAAEVTALTRVRADFFERFDWGGRVVADKHSMGGVPGGRITMILVPIVAAHGLIIPKTSSRAITSAAGTADVMECCARVDLSPRELAAVVETAGGTIAWSGRISHSALDDVMNAITRPLGIRASGLDVSSILSKKLAVGATHLVVDIPVGPAAKSRTRAEGERLARLFRNVGRAVGLTVVARLSDGAVPMGRGIGPALELEDVRKVLEGAPDAPTALRAKALTFAGTMLEWDRAVEPGEGGARAQALLDSGAAREAFEAIVAAQGPLAPARPGLFVRTMRAPAAGVVAAIDGFAAAGLARAVGAPLDKGAGGRLLATVGQRVSAGEPLMEVVASSQHAVDQVGALDAARVFRLV